MPIGFGGSDTKNKARGTENAISRKAFYNTGQDLKALVGIQVWAGL